MGLALSSVHLLAKSLESVGELATKKILTLGVQDCDFTYVEIVQLLAKHRMRHFPLPASEIQLTAGFKWVAPETRSQYRDKIHQDTLFRILGFTKENIYSLDADNFEGATFVHDLNSPCAPHLRSRFDVIFDGGTSEHVFSVKDNLFGLADMCSPGGIIINMLPVDYINHGFYNFNAELLRDFFGCNGFQQLDLRYIASPQNPRLAQKYYLAFDPAHFNHSLNPFLLTLLYSVARKTSQVVPVVPNQGFYRVLWKQDGRGPDPLPQPASRLSGRWKRELINWMDSFFFTSVLIRGYALLRKGERVVL